MPIIFTLAGQSHGIKNKGIPAILQGVIPLPQVYLRIYGVTKDSTGAALASCTVDLFRTADNAFVESVISDANGNYEFRSPSLSTAYFVKAYKAGSPDVAGVTVNTLVGT